MLAMSFELRDRLRRLGVHKGAGNLKPRSKPAQPPPDRPSPVPVETYDQNTAHFEDIDTPIAELTPRRTQYGDAYLRREAYAPVHVHGDIRLDAAFEHAPKTVATLASRRAAPFDLRDTVFLDTETTGLAGGAGTLAFLVGLGFFDSSGEFVIEQFFLKDPGHEAAMLDAIDQRVGERTNLVTFNGRAFDIPLLETRFTLSRMAAQFEDKTHLDLLMPARRVWRGRLTSCSLGSLETHVLGVRRSQQDIAGFLIPELYREYLQTRQEGLNEAMSRVMYHNLHDILSMVTLITRICSLITRPGSRDEQTAAGVFYERSGELAAAEQAYRASGDAELAQRRLAYLLKSQRRHGEAREQWQALADRDAPDALIELSKHYEWRERDIAHALACALRARAVCQDARTREHLDHRIERLQAKLAAADD
jgi:uncharacterized protein